MSRLYRFTRLVRTYGAAGAVSRTWSYIRWKARGARLPRVPSSASDWVQIHGSLRPETPDPSVLISVVVPVYNTPPGLLRECVDSVIGQTHQNWELILVDDASTDVGMSRLLDSVAELDQRVRVIRRKDNGGIAAATNTGIEQAQGAFVAFLDHDDLVVRTALEWLSTCTAITDIIYTDECKIDLEGAISDRVLKPAWSPRLLLSYNYVSHFSAVRTDLLRAVGGIDPDSSGAQDHDLMIRLAEQPVTVAHLPHVLYMWRKTPGSTAEDQSAKPYAEAAGLRAVERAIHRRGWGGSSVLGRGVPFRYAVRWESPSGVLPLVKVVIPTRDQVDMLRFAVAGLLDRTIGVAIHIVIVDNGSQDPATIQFLANLAERSDVTVERLDDAFNFSRLCNVGAALGPSTDSVLFLNNDVEVIHRDWLAQMHGWFADPEVVAVGTELLYDDRETIQHGGVAVGSGHIGWHLSTHLPNQPRAGDLHDKAHEVTGVTAACMLVRTAAFDAVGGFEEILPTDFQDVDFCLKLRRQLGGTIVYEPMFPLMHHESASRGTTNAGNGYTIARMLFRWPGLANEVDPCSHPLARPSHLGDHANDILTEDLSLLLVPRITTTLGHSVADDGGVSTQKDAPGL